MTVRSFFSASEHEKATGLLQVLSPDGTVVSDLSSTVPGDVDRALGLRLWRGMTTIRVMDERLMALQRQGRIGFYGEARGQEAAIVGSAAALAEGDWVVPALREAGAGIYRGLTLRSYVAQIFGNANDVTKGRQLPCHPCDKANHYVVMSSCVGTQIPHALGIAMAIKIAGERTVAIGYMGDGATSEPDFHVAANFAGVFRPPLILFCNNNQWAISTPGAGQTASETIAVKGLAYGLESLRVDGNDVLAVLAATRYAADKARRGDGPTFIEALTYRVSAHSSSDDPSRYRDESITLEWRTRRDPLLRASAWLRAAGWLSVADEAAMTAEIETEVREAITAEESVPPPALGSLVEDVYETVPWHLREQATSLIDSGNPGE